MNTSVPKSATEVHEKQLTRAFHYGKIAYIKSIKELANEELACLDRFFKFYLEHSNVNNKNYDDADLNEEEQRFFDLYKKKLTIYQKIDRIHSLCQYYLSKP